MCWAATVGAAAGFALVRVADPSSRRLVELVTLTPLGMPLAATGAVAALGIVIWSRLRILPGLALALALALLSVHTVWLAPLYVADSTAQLAEGEPVVVMSLNIELGEARAVTATAASRDVDVLVLLEVTHGRLDDLRAAGLTDLLPHVVGATSDEVGGTVLLSRLPIVATISVRGIGSDNIVVELASPTGPLRVVAAHPRPPYLADAWRSDHDRLLSALAALGTAAPVILAGDLNVTPAHAPMRRIRDLGFADAFDQVGAGWSPTWPAGGHERRLGVAVPAFAPIDHVLTGPGLVVTDATTLEVGDADHRAVVAVVAAAS